MEFYSPNPQMGLLPSYFGANDQKIMQGLNGRLAVYLEKVRKLEEAKCDLENKISEWSQKQAVGIVDPETEDYGSYFVIIKEEKKKLFDASSQRLTLKLQVEDTRLESEDFLIKYETELSLNRTIQNYIAGLERKQEVANTSIENLQKEYKMLSGELDSIHKEYKEEIKEMENDFNITTEVDSSLGVDLHKTLDKVREEYELLVKKNRYEVEEWYIKLMKHLNSTIVIKDEGISTGKLKIGELRSSLQTLQINLQSQLAEKKNFEDQLVVEERRYGAEIHKLQIDIGELEANIQKHRLKLEQQRREYEQLLNIKIRLEKEIRTYHDLLKTFMPEIDPASKPPIGIPKPPIGIPQEPHFKTLEGPIHDNSFFGKGEMVFERQIEKVKVVQKCVISPPANTGQIMFEKQFKKMKARRKCVTPPPEITGQFMFEQQFEKVKVMRRCVTPPPEITGGRMFEQQFEKVNAVRKSVTPPPEITGGRMFEQQFEKVNAVRKRVTPPPEITGHELPDGALNPEETEEVKSPQAKKEVRVKTIVEDVVDGKVVATYVDVEVQEKVE